MNVIFLLISLIVAILVAYFPTRKAHFLPDGPWVYFAVLIVCTIICYSLLSKLSVWWGSLGTRYNIDDIIARMDDTGDILTDTELDYVSTRKTLKSSNSANSRNSDDAIGLNSCSSIAF